MKKEDIHKKASRAGPVFLDEEYHFSVTKRKSIIIWHCKCTNKVWKEIDQ